MGWVNVGALAISAYGAYSSSQNGKKAAENAGKGNEAELDFAKQRYEDWKATYGDIQENLAKYYENLTPDFIQAQGIEQFNKERDTVLTNVRENLAKRGINNDSGVNTQIMLDTALISAEERAKIRAEAPMKAAQEQSRFLQIGLGQNPAGSVQDVLSGQARTANSQAEAAGKNASGALAGFGKTASNFIAQQFGNKGSSGGVGIFGGGTSSNGGSGLFSGSGSSAPVIDSSFSGSSDSFASWDTGL